MLAFRCEEESFINEHSSRRDVNWKEKKMSVTQIIRRIDEVIKEPQKPRQTKVEILQHLALTCWREVIPEYGAEGFKRLESDEIRRRWSVVRHEVEKYQTKDQILSVLDWPASGGNFYWIK
jgi:hypothetical protein